MLSVRPKIAELVFQLYGRSLHPELFEVHSARQIERGGYRATVQITNAGHVITWQYEGITLTEVAAAANHPLPRAAAADVAPAQGHLQATSSNAAAA